MGGIELFQSDPDDTRTQMLEATYAALQKHGYNDLTMDDIDEEFPKSKSLIYQYYGGKDELLTDFLRFMLEHYESETHQTDSLDPSDRLAELLDRTLAPTLDADERAFVRAIIALRGQAVYNDTFQEKFTETDQFFQQYIEGIIRDGIEQGQFREVDAANVGEFVSTILHGALIQRVTTTDQTDLDGTRKELDKYLGTRLGISIE